MTPQDLTAVLGWSMALNFTVFFIWVLAMILMPNLTYKTQGLVSPISRADYDRIMYRLLGQYKLALLLTHVGPYIAMRIVFT